MAQTESKMGHVEKKKRFDGLTLEVHHINSFLKRETMVNPHGTMGIFSSIESALVLPSSSVTIDDSNGHRVKPYHRDREFRLVFTHTHTLVNDMSVSDKG
jgi:hypothetical protein